MSPQRTFPHQPGGHALGIPTAMALALLLGYTASSMAQTAASAEPLQVSISVVEPQATAPFPLRVALHLHNAGNRTIWLYRPALDAGAVNGNPGGSTLAVHLEPAGSSADLRLSRSAAGQRSPDEKPQTGTQRMSVLPSAAIPAMGTVLRIPGFPHPQLMALEPGGSATENVVIHAVPSMLQSSAAPTPLWGAYAMSIAYSAIYPNGDELRRSLGVDIWSGSISS
ncbi:MAG: hypothetical protein ACRD18_07905, partial [Terriglobia bacterium]